VNTRRIALFVMPLVVLVALVGVFAVSLDKDPSYIPSVLIDKPAPDFALPPVAGLGAPGFDTDSLKGHVSVVNVFASWCIPCRDEHPILMSLKDQLGVPIYGINQKDQPDNAKAFLAEMGDPYIAVGADTNGRASIDWGVYGVPETFVVDAKGIIVSKFVGPLDANSVKKALEPAIAKAKAES
jgi:cytochrome c biogenesis protein CcmG/thiol:disulfide interchange protein DsbE